MDQTALKPYVCMLCKAFKSKDGSYLNKNCEKQNCKSLKRRLKSRNKISYLKKQTNYVAKKHFYCARCRLFPNFHGCSKFRCTKKWTKVIGDMAKLCKAFPSYHRCKLANNNFKVAIADKCKFCKQFPERKDKCTLAVEAECAPRQPMP